MTTKLLAKKPPAVLSVRAIRPPKPRGRPAKADWQQPRIKVDHPIHAFLMDAHVTIEQAMGWTGRSRTTVMRWAQAGRCPDAGLERLLALYAHGVMPIRPEHYRHPDAAEWGLMRFRLDEQRPNRRKTENPADRYQLALYTYHSNRPLNWVQVDAAGMTLAHAADRDWEIGHWKARALAAETEAARLRDMVAYQ